MVPLPPLEAGIICAARKVAIDVAALPKLLADCRAAWVSSRMAWLSVEMAAETAPEAQRAALAQQLARSSRALLFLTGGQSYTAWADRRRLLCAGWLHRDRVPQRSEGPTTEVDATAYEEELRFCASLFCQRVDTHTGCPATRAKQACITHTLALEHCVQIFRTEP